MVENIASEQQNIKYCQTLFHIFHQQGKRLDIQFHSLFLTYPFTFSETYKNT